MQTHRFILDSLKPFKYYLIGPIFLAIYWALDTSYRPYITKMIIDAASDNSVQDATKEIYKILPIYIIMQFASFLAWRLVDWCTIKYEPALKNHIARILSEKILNHSYSFFQNHFIGSLASKISDVSSYTPPIIYHILVTFLYNALAILVAFYALWEIHFWFAISFIIWVSIFIIASFFVTKKSKNLAKVSAEAGAKVIGHIVDFLGNISSVRLFNRNNQELKILGGVQKKYLIASQNRRRFLMNFYSTQGITFAIYQIACLLILIKLFSENKVTAGDFAMILSLNISMIDNLWDLSDQMRVFSENLGIVDQALVTIFQPIEIKDSPNAIDFKITKGEIDFRDVSFNYPKIDNIFQNKSILIKSGQKIGLVGYSGSGKSTFVNLILRLYDVSAGQILIDGEDIRNIKQASLRKYIATIPQDISLFHRSVMENIRYGKPDATDEEVINAAKLAHADHFIQNLADGYNTSCGERGVKLSGGQRQRIIIARAILKDAPILILDEATSQLDTVTEKMIQESVNKLMMNRTTLIVAHRLSTLRQMDRILVFNKGKIIEDGPHSELLLKDGFYRNLWDTQIEGFICDD